MLANLEWQAVLERSLRVVVVDDDPAVLGLLVRVVRNVAPNAIIISATTVRAARQALLSGDAVSLLLVDYRLMDGSGLDLVSIARRLPQRPYTILVSATPPLLSVPGVDMTINKPFDLQRLEQLLRAGLNV